jgi:MoaA/NifB/PqqE/SkfB family radical SAM enzyme
MSGLPKVVVIHPGQVVEQDAIDYPHFTGLPAAGLVRVLRNEGFFVHLLDAFCRPGASYSPLRGGYGLYGVPTAALLEPLQDAEFDVAIVHFTPYHMRPVVDAGLQHLLARLRKFRPEALIVGAELYAGGMHRVPADETFLSSRYPDLDHFVSLEAEESIPDLLAGDTKSPDFLLKGRPISAETLSMTGPPAWSPGQLANFQAFLQAISGMPKLAQYKVDDETLPIYLSRGCPFNCSFCSNPYQDYRAVPLDVVVEWLDWSVEAGAQRLFVLDDAANVRPDFEDVLSAASKRNLSLEFPNGLRADLLSKERISLLADVSEQLTVSAESGSARLQRDVVGKNVHLSHIERVAAWCSAANLPLSIHWLVALPGETRSETVVTLDAARRLLDEHGAQPLVQFATPLPGTALAKETVTGDIGETMQHHPTFLPEKTTAEELGAAVSLVRQRGRDAQTAKVIINLTYRCNNHCVFCAVGNRLPEDQSLAHIKAVLDRYAAAGVELLDLDGGEPTLHPDLLEIIEYARKSGFRTINITTNGRRLAYPEFARKLLASGITSLLVSVHGPDEKIHDSITGTPGSFAETMQGIRNVVKFAPADLDFGVNTTLSMPNYERLNELVELLVSEGVEKFNFQFLTPFGRAAADLAPPPEDAAEMVRQVIQEHSDRARFQVINLPYCYLPGLEDFVAQDLGKLARNMVFVTKEEVNLYEYLSDTRAYGEECGQCLYRVGCDGKYDFSEVHN